MVAVVTAADYEYSYTGSYDSSGSGISNTDMKTYIAANFTTVPIDDGLDIYNHLSGGGGSYVVAAIESHGIGHAIIIQGINSDGTYYGYDPSSKESLNDIDGSSIYANSMIGVCGL